MAINTGAKEGGGIGSLPFLFVLFGKLITLGRFKNHIEPQMENVVFKILS
jgi:hypothetical protein